MVKDDMLLENKIPIATDYMDSFDNLSNAQKSSNNSLSNESNSVCHPIGKNLYNGETEIGSIDINGNNTTNNNAWRTKDYIEVLENTNYDLSLYNLTLSYSVGRIKFYDENKSYLGFSEDILVQSNEIHILTPNNCKYIRWFMLTFNVPTTTNIQLEQGIISSEYEPYEGCLYGLELYDMIETNFITNNYYVNCGVIALFLALIVILVNAPFIFIRKIKGD